MNLRFRILRGVLFLAAGLLLPIQASAYTLPGNWAATICGIIPCSAGAPGAIGLSSYLFAVLVTGLEVGFIGIAALLLFIYSVTLVISGYEENVVTEVRLGYSYAIAGAAIVSLAHLLTEAFSPTWTGAAIVNYAPLTTGFGNVIFYFKVILSAALTFNIVYQAIRLITAHEQGSIDNARKQLLFGFVGAAVILLANAVVTAINPEVGEASDLANELVGVTNFLLALFGFGVVLSIIIAGIMLVVSVDEGLKDKAKNIIKTAVISLAVILAAYAIVSTFGDEELAEEVSWNGVRSIAAETIGIPQASAQGIADTIGVVGRLLPPGFSGQTSCSAAAGACGFVNIVLYLIEAIRPALFIFAVFLIVLTGFRMVISQEDDILQKGIKIISACATGLIMSYLIVPFIDAFYGFTNGVASVARGNMIGGAEVAQTEILGLLHWAFVVLGVIAVTVIVISGIRALLKAGSEEGITEVRRTVFSVIAGLILIVFSQIINRTFGLDGVSLPGAISVGPLLDGIVAILQFILGFLALVAVVMFVYAGFVMVLNFGQEEQFTKAKTLLLRVAIGIVVILISVAIVQLVIGAATGETGVV